jgi:hypothetical protein
VSLPTVKRYLRRFREGDTSCEDRKRARRPFTSLGDVFSKFLSKYSLASANNIASHFDISVSTVKYLLARELGLRKLPRRWVPHFLSERQKIERVTQSRLLLGLLQRHQTADCNRRRVLVPIRVSSSRSNITSCIRSGIGTSKVMITIFTGTRLFVLKALPKGRKFDQDYFLEEVLPSLSRQKR